MIPQNKLSKNLLIANKNIKKATPENFIRRLCEFYESIDPQTIDILEAHIIAQKNEDMRPYIEAEQNLLQAIFAALEEIESYYLRSSLVPPMRFMSEESISEFRSSQHKTIIADRPLIDCHIQTITNVLSVLMRANLSPEEILQLLQKHFIFCIDHAENIESFRLIDSSDTEVQSVYNDISILINTKRIINETLTALQHEFHKHASIKRPEKVLLLKETLLSMVQIILQSDLNASDHAEFVKQYAILNGNGHITGLREINSLFNHYNAITEDLKRYQKIRLWYAYEQVKGIYLMWKRFSTIRLDLFNNGHIFAEFNLCHTFKKITSIDTGKQIEYLSDLKDYQQKIFHFVQELFPASVSAPSKDAEKKEAMGREILITAFIESNGTIRLSNKHKSDKITFKPFVIKANERRPVFRNNFLHSLLNNPAGLSTQNLRKELKASDNKQIYTARTGINGELKAKWNIDEYISRDKSGKFKINDRHLTKLIHLMSASSD
jgi:hypothetical protein